MNRTLWNQIKDRAILMGDGRYEAGQTLKIDHHWRGQPENTWTRHEVELTARQAKILNKLSQV